MIDTAPAPTPQARPHSGQSEQPPQQRVLRRFLRNRGAIMGLVLVATLVLLALLAPWLAPHNPNQQHRGQRLAPPSAEFPLGTDNLSRDLLSRLLYGARLSLGATLLATVVIVLIGVLVGALAGYMGGLVDSVLMRIVDTLLAFPGLLLALAIVGMLGPGLTNAIIAVVLVGWADYARIVRGVVLSTREQPYIEAAVALGVRPPAIVLRHVLPNALGPIIVLASLEMGALILTLAGLSFIGLGAQPPTAEWGAMLDQGRAFFQRAPQLMLYPGLLITLAVLGFNLLGDGLRDALDPTRGE
ncbi:MAG: ABC transporter permease [Chloroflexaceae bacterium]|jgi:peptide/nickel transport system permease protein|nr:ABC transporter permease [Chloroflexaceae bacterium]